MPDQNTPTMDDRTLIERAAKAAGYRIDEKLSDATWRDIRRLAILNDRGGHTLWNANEDDGDIARLEAAIGLDVFWNKEFVEAYCPEQDPFGLALVHEKYDDHGGDKQKARRYASTRAAAALAQGE